MALLFLGCQSGGQGEGPSINLSPDGQGFEITGDSNLAATSEEAGPATAASAPEATLASAAAPNNLGGNSLQAAPVASLPQVYFSTTVGEDFVAQRNLDNTVVTRRFVVPNNPEYNQGGQVTIDTNGLNFIELNNEDANGASVHLTAPPPGDNGRMLFLINAGENSGFDLITIIHKSHVLIDVHPNTTVERSVQLSTGEYICFISHMEKWWECKRFFKAFR